MRSSSAGARRRIVVGISGASAPHYGIPLLRRLRDAGVETHLVVSAGARRTIGVETDHTVAEVTALADKTYQPGDLAAATEAGATVLPPVPAFYHAPATVQDVIDHTVGKILDQLDVPHDAFTRWGTVT